MDKEKRERETKNRIRVKIVFIFILFLILFLAFLIFIRLGGLSFFETIQKKSEFVDIKGECYYILDNLFYQIASEDDCKRECYNECWVRKKDYSGSKFILTPNSCNNCSCYCK